MSLIDRSSRQNLRLGLICGAVFAGMVGMAYASVPLYRAFCQATGFGGTTQRASAPPDAALDRTVEVRFDANVRGGLPWRFTADQTRQTVKIGASSLAFFKVTNTGDKPYTGRAVYNVVPAQAGAYFQKLECFCFQSQVVKPGQTIEFPVVYFIDPQFAADSETKGGTQITLSYTFYPDAEAGAVTPATVSTAAPLGGTVRRGL